jgi:pentatricopeptide repeat protein
MDPDTYEAYVREKDHLDLVAAVRRAREDVKAGRVRDAEEFFDEMFAKYDIPWNE